MNTRNKFAAPLLAGVGLMAAVFACRQDAIVDVPADTATANSSIQNLIALGEKTDPSDNDVARFTTLYQQLSFDDLMLYRKGQHTALRKQHGNAEEVNRALASDLVWWETINKESMSRFGKTANQITGIQLDQLLERFPVQQSAKQGRGAAACPVINFNTSFTRGTGGTTNLSTLSAREVDPGGRNDCDCQVSFGTSNTNFRRLRPLNATATNLLNDFGGTLGGRQLTGASAGSFPVWGKGRVTVRYPGAVFSGCNVLLNQYTLSNR